jgi:mannobiose 2-epimerase
MTFNKFSYNIFTRSIQSTSVDFAELQKRLERILSQNIIPFWYPQCLDLEQGGYRLNHDIHGQWQGNVNKRLVTQARTLYFFSYLARTPYGSHAHLAAAKHGYEFLRNKLWDQEFDGFYWEVDPSGKRATMPNKHLYGQAFGLYALSEYAITSGDSSAVELAHRLFHLLEEYAHDSQYGGYKEFFSQDWSPVSSEIDGYIGAAATTKLMNTHLHLLEAITAYYLLTKDVDAKARLAELTVIQSNTILHKSIGACRDRHHKDWIPLDDSKYNRISYGHDLENIWLLIETCIAIDLSNHLLLDFYRTLFDYSLRYGFDYKRGGFYFSGPFNRPADDKKKNYWVQAESLIAALQMHRLTERSIYLNCFCKTLDWLENYQIDWNSGDWYTDISSKGIPSGDKAGIWKAAYHNGRAMLKCLELLKS